jgi:hypothetical protein
MRDLGAVLDQEEPLPPSGGRSGGVDKRSLRQLSICRIPMCFFAIPLSPCFYVTRDKRRSHPHRDRDRSQQMRGLQRKGCKDKRSD